MRVSNLTPLEKRRKRAYDETLEISIRKLVVTPILPSVDKI